MDKNCIFCKIISGEINSYCIYEDDLVMAFLDINPESNGHTLLVPKTHYQDLYDIDEEKLNHLMICAKKISSLITDKLHCDGITLMQNNGLSQDVKHFHLHIKPCYTEKQNKIDLEEIKRMLNV